MDTVLPIGCHNNSFTGFAETLVIFNCKIYIVATQRLDFQQHFSNCAEVREHNEHMCECLTFARIRKMQSQAQLF